MKYIHRDMETKILALSREYACILLTGARQVGKTTLLKALDGDRHYVTLDDLDERRLAKTEPATFLAVHPCPVLIDEVQYAPELFSYIKMAVDNGASPGNFWLTGSQSFSLMKLAQESLAGRTAILHLPTLSQQEMYGNGNSEPFTLSPEALKKRQAIAKSAGLGEIYERIWRGSMPGLAGGKYTDRQIFYGGYLETYISRDVGDLMPRVDKLRFQDFIRAAACRAGQMLNVHSIALDVGISDDAAKRWLDILLQSDVIFYLRPYSNNLLKRTVKMPKLYFADTGLVAYLTRYLTPEILGNGAINGAILENYVVAEIRKSYLNAGQEPLLWYYRDRDNREIDLVMEENGALHPMEIKRTLNPSGGIQQSFSVLDKASLPRGTGAILCLKPTLSAIDKDTLIVPIWMI